MKIGVRSMVKEKPDHKLMLLRRILVAGVRVFHRAYQGRVVGAPPGLHPAPNPINHQIRLGTVLEQELRNGRAAHKSRHGQRRRR